MKDAPAAVSASKARVAIIAFAFLIPVGAIPVQGQTHPLQPVDITNRERVRQQEMSEREWELRNLANEPGKAGSDRKRAQAIVDQVEQDFKRIVALHNEFARSLSSGTPLDYTQVSEAAGEIKKRASRLQNTLALPKAGADEQAQQRDDLASDEKQIRDALTKLCKHIESFIDNPIIATPGTIDAKQSTRARRDLAGVIEIGDLVKKSANKLKKTAR